MNARSSVVLLIAALTLACTRESGDSANQPDDAGGARVRRVAQQEWERILEPIPGLRYDVASFRAGGGIVTTVHHPPSHSDAGLPGFRWRFTLADSGRYFNGGVVRTNRPEDPASLTSASDVVSVTARGWAWFLDSARGRVIAENMGKERGIIASFGIPETVRTACALNESAIVFLDSERAGRAFIHDLGIHRTRTLVLPPNAAGLDSARWEDVRLDGSQYGSCVLTSPHMHGAMIISHAGVTVIDEFIEPPGARQDPRWYRALGHAIRPSVHPQGAIDATSFPGGVAILYAGRTAAAGRLVDLYTDDGRYLETMQLHRPVRRIAATRHRLITYASRGDTAYLGSYVLPPRVRAMASDTMVNIVAPTVQIVGAPGR